MRSRRSRARSCARCSQTRSRRRARSSSRCAWRPGWPWRKPPAACQTVASARTHGISRIGTRLRLRSRDRGTAAAPQLPVRAPDGRRARIARRARVRSCPPRRPACRVERPSVRAARRPAEVQPRDRPDPARTVPPASLVLHRLQHDLPLDVGLGRRPRVLARPQHRARRRPARLAPSKVEARLGAPPRPRPRTARLGGMRLPVVPPVQPMLAKLVRELPLGDYLYEPKWDGFRCIAFRDGDEIAMRSRNDRPLARYFPELVEALLAVDVERFVLDGEILVEGDDGFEFTPLLQRLHPAASRVERLRNETPATLRAFDLLALGDEDLFEAPFARRREELERLIPADGGTLSPTALTSDPAVAASWLERFDGHGVDGVMAKPRDLPYEPGRRAMLKVKTNRTLDCVVAGFRVFEDRPLPSSLLLGLYDESGALQSIGVASSFSERVRHELLEELRPLVAPLAGHPWEHGFLVEGGASGRLPGAATRWDPAMMELDWIPIAPLRVAEVSYDHLDNRRLRHPARFRHWRPDRDPESCTFEQAEHAVADPRELVG